MPDGLQGSPFKYYNADNRTDDIDKVIKRAKALWTEAKNTYQIHEPHDFVLAFHNQESMLKLKHCGAAGAAGVIRRPNAKVLLLVRISKAAVEQNLNAVLEDVVPHELAHLVCMLRPQHGHGHNHDNGWVGVCKRLGGSGQARYPVGTFNL